MDKNKEFDNILDECLERLLVKGETLEQCLAHYPEQAAALRPLLETALTAKRASAIQPRPEFRARARYQFQAALQTVTAKRRFFPLAWPRWATVVAVVLALVLAGGGTVAAAGNSMPDEPLYPVKLATEQVRLALTPSNISKAELYANLADRRVTEIVSMANKNKPRHLERVTNRLNNDLAMVAVLARARAREEKVALAPAPAPSPPAEAGQDRLVYPRRNYRLARLRMAVARYAVNHPAELRAMLRTAPESAKPALRRAIAIAEARYQQALEAVGEPGGDR
jgi:hypothetical protein